MTKRKTHGFIPNHFLIKSCLLIVKQLIHLLEFLPPRCMHLKVSGRFQCIKFAHSTIGGYDGFDDSDPSYPPNHLQRRTGVYRIIWRRGCAAQCFFQGTSNRSQSKFELVLDCLLEFRLFNAESKPFVSFSLFYNWGYLCTHMVFFFNNKSKHKG